jgi:hypothetical protein
MWPGKAHTLAFYYVGLVFYVNVRSFLMIGNEKWNFDCLHNCEASNRIPKSFHESDLMMKQL